jgi:hypothetical protein
LDFGFSAEYIKALDLCRLRIKNYVGLNFKKSEKTKAKPSKTCRNFDEYLNVMDDFKTNLMWLSIFVNSVEGVSMRIPVNYRQVSQQNFFKPQGEEQKTMLEAAYEPDGDTFQNSPLKLVFYSAFPKVVRKARQEDHLKLTSISQVNVNPGKASLPKQKGGVPIQYMNMTIQMEDVVCMWPREEDLRDLLYFFGFHPIDNLGESVHYFPWNDILSLFNGKDMNDGLVLKQMLRQLSLDFLYEDHWDIGQNLKNFKQFYQFMSPVSGCAVEGDHRIEMASRLLYSIALKEEAPFLTPLPPDPATTSEQDSVELLPFNSTVHKPIQAVVYSQKPSSSNLCANVTNHMKLLSRKVASQKKLYIRDSWRSLYSAIYSAVDSDLKFRKTLYASQQELYEQPLSVREKSGKANNNRQRLSEIIADVIFQENPTSTLAATSKTNISKWKEGVNINAWIGVDSNPFPTVCKIPAC